MCGAMDLVISALRKIERVYLKDIVFVALVILYLVGPLEFVSLLIPTLWSLPPIFVLSGFVWNALEEKLSEQRIKTDGKAIFISGCDTGFGFELARRMANKGFDVYAGCLFPDGDGAQALSELPNIFVLGFDVTKDESIADALVKIKHRLRSDGKTLWGVVANAGIAMLAPIEWCPMKDIQTLFDVNVFGVIRTVKIFLPMLRKSGGRLVITSSISGITGTPLLIAYSMTKAAVKSLTEGLRRELGDNSKVYVTCLLPGFHRTPMVEKMTSDELERRFSDLPDAVQTPGNRKILEGCKRQQKAITSLLIEKDLSGPLECFDHALTSTRPRPFYICDRPLMRYIVCPVMQHFPIESTDFLFTKAGRMAEVLKYLIGAKTQRTSNN